MHMKLRFSAGQNIPSTTLKDGWDKVFAAKTRDWTTLQRRRKQPPRQVGRGYDLSRSLKTDTWPLNEGTLPGAGKTVVRWHTHLGGGA